MKCILIKSESNTCRTYWISRTLTPVFWDKLSSLFIANRNLRHSMPSSRVMSSKLPIIRRQLSPSYPQVRIPQRQLGFDLVDAIGPTILDPVAEKLAVNGVARRRRPLQPNRVARRVARHRYGWLAIGNWEKRRSVIKKRREMIKRRKK